MYTDMNTFIYIFFIIELKLAKLELKAHFSRED